MSLHHECSALSIDSGLIHLPGSNSVYLTAQLSPGITPPFVFTVYYGLKPGFSSDLPLKTNLPTPLLINCVEYQLMHRESGMVTVPPPTLEAFAQSPDEDDTSFRPRLIYD